MPNPLIITDEDRSILTPDELAALDDKSFVDEGAPGTPEGEGEPDKQPAPNAAPEPEPAAAPVVDPDAPPAPAAAEPAPAPTQEPAPQPEPAKAPGTVPAAEAPRDFNAELEKIRADRAALATKMRDGEIDEAEWQKQDQVLQDSYFDVRSDQRDQTRSIEQALTSFTNEMVPSFLAAAPHADYAVPGSARYDALDAEVRRQQQAVIDSGGDQRAALARPILEKAMAKVAAQFGDKATAGTPNPTPRPNPPPTLADVPAADVTDDVGDAGRFAHLDRLAESNYEEYETALARLSEADRQRYLQQ